ncbi:MAG: glycosyltransferase family 4 protein [Terriglobales bacterium]
MRVLLVHNFYGSSAPSGENQVFKAERALLESRGNSVFVLIRDSDRVRSLGLYGEIRAGLSTPWNMRAADEIRTFVRRVKPDVVHVHNTFPLLSPAVFRAAGGTAARVLTLHNYRLFCAAAIPMRQKRVCTECLDRGFALPAVQHGCYRGSRLATLPLAISVEVHRRLGTWQRDVEAFIALSEFQRDTMAGAGLPRKRIHVKPNFCVSDVMPRSWASRDDAVIYAGRLSVEKGVRDLIRAWSMWGPEAPELRIVGNGPLRAELESASRECAGVRIRFLGQKNPAQTRDLIAACKLLILPSTWFETFGMVVCEAFAAGTPAAVSNLGALPSIVQEHVTGTIFPAGNPLQLLEAVRRVWVSPELEQMGVAARRRYEERFSDDANYSILMDVYEQAIECRSKRSPTLDVR